MALENTSFPNYCTEKIWQGWPAGVCRFTILRHNLIYDIFPSDCS